jgi:hypothetical protein
MIAASTVDPCRSTSTSIHATLADTASLQASASRLLNDQYGAAGYGSGRRVTLDAFHLPFVSMLDGRVVSTVTLAVDGPARLAIDQTFPDELAYLRRAPLASLCALTLFASEAQATKEHLAALFSEVFRVGSSRFGCTDLLIEVNPRHVRFYRILLGFDLVAERFNTGVGAPAVLLRRSVRELGANIATQAGGTLFQAAGRQADPPARAL